MNEQPENETPPETGIEELLGRARLVKREGGQPVYEMTPEKAAELLRRGTRPLNRDKAAEYARQMQEGPWRPVDGVCEIGPDEARHLVSLAAVRYVAARLDGKRVAKYASFMLLGTWQPSPEPIPITEDGYLVNGLNRLMAVILSGTTQQFVIATAPHPVAELGMAFHSGPRVRDIEMLPEDHPAL